MVPPTEDSYFNQAFFDSMDAYIRQHGPQHHHQKIAERYQKEFGMKSRVDLKQLARIWTAERLAQREIYRQNEHEFITMLRNCGFGWNNASGMVFGSDAMWTIVMKVRRSATRRRKPLMKWRTTKSGEYQDMVTCHMKLDATQTMKLIDVSKDGNALMQHYPELDETLLEDADRYKVSLEQEAAQQAINAIVTPTIIKSNLDDNKAAAIFNLTLQPALSQPLKRNPQPLQQKKVKAAPKANAPQATISALRRQQKTLAAMESTPSANAPAAQKATGDKCKQATGDNENGKQLADDEQPPQKGGQSKSSKRRAAKKRSDALKAAVTFDGNLQSLATKPSASIASPDPEPSTSGSAAAAAAAAVSHARAYQAQPEDELEDGDSQDGTTEWGDAPESEASATDDHEHGECTCNCEPRRLYLNGDEIQTYDPNLMTDFATKHFQLKTLIVAAELKLRADHLHNIWFGCVAAIRECDCGPCSAPYSPCYEWIARTAKEEYWAADKKLDDLLEQKKTQLRTEIIAIMKPKGRDEKVKANSYFRNRNLPNGLIKSLLPDGRDKEVEARGRGRYPLIPVIFDLNI